MMEEMRGRLDNVENNSSQISKVVYSERDRMNELTARVHAQEATSTILENKVCTCVHENL